VKGAPHLDVAADEPLMEEHMTVLYRYYGVGDTAEDRGPTTGRGTDDAMTRSEEQLRVRTERETVGRARLRKYVVTENVEVTVPVRREVVRVEQEPVAGGDPASRDAAGPDTGVPVEDDVTEVVLHAERPVVTTETVPVERVRLAKQTFTEDRTVTGDVRKERIDVDLSDEEPERLL
jgi:uncharacterized protein (TIGR02271 family)